MECNGKEGLISVRNKMYEFIQKNSDSSVGLPLTQEDRIKFLEDNLNNKDIQSEKELNSIRFQCFQSLFNSILTTITSEQNLKKEFSNSSKFVGIDILWDFVVKCPECTTAREAIKCLSSLFCSVDPSAKYEFINDQDVSSLLDLSDKTAKLAWEVVNRLSTNGQIFADVIALKGVRDVPIPNQDWNIILPLDLRYKLQYNLQVIACLVDEEEISEVGKQIREEVFAQNSEFSNIKKHGRLILLLMEV